MLYLGKTRQRTKVELQQYGALNGAIRVSVGELSRLTHKEIIAKRLLLLIPFYPLKYLHRFAKMEKSARSRKKLMREYTWLCCEILAWRVDGRLDDMECDMLYLNMMEIVQYVTRDYPQLRKELSAIMERTLLEKLPEMQFMQDWRKELQAANAKAAAMAQEKERAEQEKERAEQEKERVEQEKERAMLENRETYVRAQEAGLPPQTLAYIFGHTAEPKRGHDGK